MKTDLPDEVEGARRLLEESITSNVHKEKTRLFEDGIDILEEYLAEEPNSTHKNLAANVKMTYTRKLLEQLSDIVNVDISEWFDYYKILVLKVKNEVNQNIQANLILKDNYEGFISIWKDKVREIILRDISKSE